MKFVLSGFLINLFSMNSLAAPRDCRDLKKMNVHLEVSLGQMEEMPVRIQSSLPERAKGMTTQICEGLPPFLSHLDQIDAGLSKLSSCPPEEIAKYKKNSPKFRSKATEFSAKHECGAVLAVKAKDMAPAMKRDLNAVWVAIQAYYADNKKWPQSFEQTGFKSSNPNFKFTYSTNPMGFVVGVTDGTKRMTIDQNKQFGEF